VLNAEGERQAAILRAEEKRRQSDTVFTAIHEGKPDRELLSYEYLQMLPQLAKATPTRCSCPLPVRRGLRRDAETLTRRAGADSGSGGGGARAPRAAGRRRRKKLSERHRDVRFAARSCGTLAACATGGTLTEQDIDAAMREIRLALLEADVNFKVVRQFTRAARALPWRAGDRRLNPGQQVVKIVGEELAALMGGAAGRSGAPREPDGGAAGGAAGLGKTTGRGEAREAPASDGYDKCARRLRRLPSRRGRAARQARKASRGRVYERGPSTTRRGGGWALGGRGRWRRRVIVTPAAAWTSIERLMEELVRMRSSLNPTTCCWSWTR